MLIADEIRAITERASAEQNNRELERQAQITANKQSREAQAELDAPAYFAHHFLPKITEEAAKGRRDIHFSYRHQTHNYAGDDTEIRAVAKHAQSLGFQTRFDHRTVDHGDSAAPAATTEYYLILSW